VIVDIEQPSPPRTVDTIGEAFFPLAPLDIPGVVESSME
jgi:hypothetical protein